MFVKIESSFVLCLIATSYFTWDKILQDILLLQNLHTSYYNAEKFGIEIL